MMKLAVLTAACAALCAAQTERVPIDNAYVKVIRAHNSPGQKSQLHQHTVNRVMIHLDDGQMRLAYAGGKVSDFKWKAGDVRWDPAGGMHTSQNTGAGSYRIIEVELKQAGGKPVTFSPLDPVAADPRHYKVLFDNPQVRIVRATYGGGESGPMHEHALKRLTANLSAQHVRLTLPNGEKRELSRKAEEVVWSADPARHSEVNLNKEAFEVILIELKQ
ncbi:MAG: hypothetical protein JJE04_07275 [Acidobacteriia bacterium]|nr:hypothetical protein [Terriglobia bacterium]